MMTVRILAFFNRIFQGQVKFKNYGKKYNLIILDHDASETIYGLKYFQINYLFGEHWELCFDYMMSFLDTSRYVSTEFRCLQIRFSLRFVLTLDRNTYNLIVWFKCLQCYADRGHESWQIKWNIEQLLNKIIFIFFNSICTSRN